MLIKRFLLLVFRSLFCGKPIFAMDENQISGTVLDACFHIHCTLGPGLIESVYEEVLCDELSVKRGLFVQRQHPIPVVYDELKMELSFRADLIVERKVIVEIKSIDLLAPVHHKQLLTYLRLTGLKVGLLVNFNETLIKDGVKRIVNNL